MDSLSFEPAFWHWFILAVVLIIAEVLASGTFFLWTGVAAAAVGLLLLAVPTLGWEYQVLLFAGLSVASVYVWRRYLKTHPTQTDQPRLNRRGEQYIGRIFTLAEPIVNGQGKIRVDDSTWKVRGEDCSAGTRVVVSSVDGVVLEVEKPPG